MGGNTTGYVYDANRSLPVVLEDGSRKYVWGVGLAYAVDGAGNVQVYHADGLGSVRALSDASAQVVQSYSTDEFGTDLLMAAEEFWIAEFSFAAGPRPLYDRLQPKTDSDLVGSLREIMLDDITGLRYCRRAVAWYERGHLPCGVSKDGRAIVW